MPMNRWFLSIFFTIFSLVGSAFFSYADEGSQYDRVRSRIARIVGDHPKVARQFTLGVSDGGLPIEGVVIGDGSIHHLVVGTHHGNEYGSTEVALGFAEALADQPLLSKKIFIIPVLNISGYNENRRREKGFDPNRDYPGPCGTEGPFKLKSTFALAKFIDEQQIIASATLHTFNPAVVYPWGFGTRDLSTPDEGLFKKLVQLATVESGYPVGNSSEVVYPANGTFEDYAYWKHGIWSLLFELGHSHSPSEAEVNEMIRRNIPGLTQMMESAPQERARDHSFKGACDRRLLALDRHDE